MLFQTCKKSICVIVVLVLVASCSDDPAVKAAKELRKSASKALAVDTNENVLDDLNKALKKSSAKAGKAADPVRMTAVNIALDSARGMIDKMDDYDSQAEEELAKITLTIHNANELQIEYEHLKKVTSAAGEQINTLQKQIDGDKQAPGVKKQLEAATANITKLKEPQEKVVVYLDPKEYQSHWLGNKSIYRTRMVMADDGELIVIAPGLHEYGEDPEMDRLIRKYGYHGTEEILREVDENEDLRGNLAAAAHLIHGSSEGRFNITYAPGHLTPEETRSVGYQWADVN